MKTKKSTQVKTADRELQVKLTKNLNAGQSCFRISYLMNRDVYKDQHGNPLLDDPEAFTQALKEQGEQLNQADFGPLVSRLNGHLAIMEPLFIKMAWAVNQTNNVEQIVKLTNCLTKIQSNMRTTAQTICDLKHPRQQVNFVRAETANLSNGPQQNNITNQATTSNTHVSKSENEQNELLGVGNGLDR